MNTNLFIGIGNLTRDAELKMTTNGKAVLNFSIAVNKMKKDDVMFLDVALWGKSAEAVSQYMKRGKKVCVNGKLDIQRWEKDGVKFQKPIINCFDIELLSGTDKQDDKFIAHESNTVADIDMSIPF